MRATLALALALTACTSAEPLPSTPPPENTVVVPHRGATFDPARTSALWCATFEMAWQALGRDVLKGPPLLGAPAPAEFVAGMNANPYPLDAVDAASCIAVAGRKGDGILDRIAKEGREKFGKDLPGMAVNLEHPTDILAYAFLRKSLPFERPFETIDGGLAFEGVQGRLPAWGLNAGDRIGADALRAQVRLLHRAPADAPDAFVLEFTPKGGADRILLARVPGSPTLAAAWTGVEERIRTGKARALRHEAVLKVPRIRASMLRRYGEIEGASVTNAGFEKLFVAEALQTIDFRLDEAGAELESEAALLLKAAEARERPDVFLFDRPFLVALIRRDAKEPYFLAWIGNGDLLAR